MIKKKKKKWEKIEYILIFFDKDSKTIIILNGYKKIMLNYVLDMQKRKLKKENENVLFDWTLSVAAAPAVIMWKRARVGLKRRRSRKRHVSKRDG